MWQIWLDIALTPAFVATTELSHLHGVKYLTDKQGWNPVHLDEAQHTPLHHASMKGYIYMDIVKLQRLG